MNGCDPDVVLELMAIDVKGKEDASERAMNTPDALGRLPIHYACKHKHLKPAIEKLIELNPESLKKADSQRDMQREMRYRSQAECSPVNSVSVFRRFRSFDSA